MWLCLYITNGCVCSVVSDLCIPNGCVCSAVSDLYITNGCVCSAVSDLYITSGWSVQCAYVQPVCLQLYPPNRTTLVCSVNTPHPTTQLTTASGHTYRMGGIAKGSGMIHPNMATMLAVVTCDAPVAPDLWRSMFKRASVNSFNQITVDGDTSTNDCVLGLTSGLGGGPAISDERSPAAVQLEAGLTALLQGLAKSIAWDGEGATCLIEVQCVGAESQADANTVAKSVAGSSLVKSAIFGGDPNWGRIAAAAGYAGVGCDGGVGCVQGVCRVCAGCWGVMGLYICMASMGK